MHKLVTGINVDGQYIPIVPSVSRFKVLGVQVAISGGTSAEFEHRLAAAWAKFHSLKHLLCRKGASILRRLKMFDSIVSKTALWCSAARNLTKEQLRRLRSTRNEMIRRIVGNWRHPNEEYVPWIQRSTRQARILASRAGLKCWTTQHLKQKWIWGGRLARMEPRCWPHRVSFWTDVSWQSAARFDRPLHPQRGRPFRWEDSLHKHSNFLRCPSWRQAAQSEATWNSGVTFFAAKAGAQQHRVPLSGYCRVFPSHVLVSPLFGRRGSMQSMQTT